MMVLTKALIKESEETAVASGSFSYKDLMLRAGTRVAETIAETYGCENKKILFLCGSGNNGGDGFVAANKLIQIGADVEVFLTSGNPKTENAKFFYEKLPEEKTIKRITDNYDIIVDAIFGIGLNRGISGSISETIDYVNSMSSIRISIDVPSGVICDSGNVEGSVFNADLTITFISLKPCFLLPIGSDYCGKIKIADIGVKPAKFDYLTIENPNEDRRLHNSHKGTYGTAGLICGSYGMAGAAILSAKAALRSGVGIAKCIICDKIYSAFTCAVPEAVCIPVKTANSGSPDGNDDKIYDGLNSCKAILLGCGLKNTADTETILKKVLKNYNCPIVIDADGINSLANGINIIRETKAPVILTPHPGEMSKLFNTTVSEIEKNRIKYAKLLSDKYNCITVLKGANTIVTAKDSDIWFNTTGNPGMATGGSGDVLSGIIVSLLAQGIEPLNAVKNAVYLHGYAADVAAKKRSFSSLLPTDIIEELR